MVSKRNKLYILKKIVYCASFLENRYFTEFLSGMFTTVSKKMKNLT